MNEIECQEQYIKYVKSKRKVGSNSIKSYVTYLQSVARHLDITINPKVLNQKTHNEMVC